MTAGAPPPYTGRWTGAMSASLSGSSRMVLMSTYGTTPMGGPLSLDVVGVLVLITSHYWVGVVGVPVLRF